MLPILGQESFAPRLRRLRFFELHLPRLDGKMEMKGSKPPLGAELGTCHGPNCKAAIFWVKTENGSLTPLDTKPVKVYVKVRGYISDPRYYLAEAWVSHYATCMDVESFRRKPDGSSSAIAARTERFLSEESQ